MDAGVRYIFILLLATFSRAQAAPSLLKPLVLAPEDQVILNRMTTAQKVGQLLLIGFMGHEINEGLAQTITDVRPGGLILFSRNIHAAPQVVTLVADAQKLAVQTSGVPLLVGVDQEGGNVIRIKTALPLPSALAFGEAGDRSIVESAGIATGSLLKILGINLNFAPVLDVNDPSKKSFIGTRTYGSSAKVVSEMGVSFARGLENAGVLATGKHFPGHGGIDVDSHKITPQKNLTLAEMQKSDLMPFTAMKTTFGDKWAVMLGHVAYPTLDPSGLPATFSGPIVNGLLRDQMGFNGVVVTDDIEMAGASVVTDIHERVVRTIEAGADMIMVAWNKRLQRELVVSLMRAVKSGRISRARLDESVKRILIAKRAFAQPRAVAPTTSELRVALQNPVFGDVAQRAMAIRFARAPVARELAFRDSARGKSLMVFSSNQRFSENFKRALPDRAMRFYPLDPERPDLIDRAMRANPRSVGVFYVSGSETARILNRVGDDVKQRMLVVSVEAQGELLDSERFGSIADVYYRHPALGRLVAEHYFGGDVARVRVPASASRTLSR